jgi:DNA processing protein
VQEKEIAAWLRLRLTPGIGPVHARKLLAAFGLPQDVWMQSPAALAAVVGAERARALQTVPADLGPRLDQTLTWLQTAPGQSEQPLFLTLGDPRYPAVFLELPDPPLFVFALASRSLAERPAAEFSAGWSGRSLAVVGSRNPTPAGVSNARALSAEFVRGGVCVISGLALGIDGAAHEGALQAWDAGAVAGRCPTVAVVGTGLDRVYPRRHHALARRIAQAGVIFSEYLPGTPAQPVHFLQRNRLIAALSRGTMVVEAALQSGSLTTARLALELGREVFALPGSIHSVQSKGCHLLIKQGARLAESAQDVWEELGWQGPPPAPDRRQAPPSVSLHADALDAMGYDPVDLDTLMARTRHDAAGLQALLLELELSGVVARLPGGLFQRLAA